MSNPVNGCPEDYISWKNDTAPDRFSIQTGIVCSLFGLTHPLCKWVDELLPSLPIPQELKDVGKQIARLVRRNINRKAYAQLLKVMRSLSKFQDIFNQIEETNQLIEDLENSINGGEVYTLEFCLAGKPDFPETVNWGDIFLAFTGIYPDFLIEKMSKIFAYQKYFEYCHCKQIQEFDEPEIINDTIEIPTGYTVTGTNDCIPCWKNLLDNVVDPINRTAKQFNLQVLEQKMIEYYWMDNLYFDTNEDHPYTAQVLYSTTSGDFITRDIVNSTELFFSGGCPEGGEINPVCCRLYYKQGYREIETPMANIKYTFVHPEYGTTETRYGFDWYLEVTNTGRYLQGSKPFYLVTRGENVCYKSPVGESFNPEEIENIDPTLNPCESEFAENYPELCVNCPPKQGCTEESIEVSIYDCQRQQYGTAVRTLLANTNN